MKELRVVADIETDGLNPSKIHLLVCKTWPTGEVYVFKDAPAAREFANGVTGWIGHNFSTFDAPVLNRLWGLDIPPEKVTDTLVCSRLFESTRTGRRPHSIESWGETLGRPKTGADITDWSELTPEMEARCVSDVGINFLLYRRFERLVTSPAWQSALQTEHFMHRLCEELHENGFAFDKEKALELKAVIEAETDQIDTELRQSFPLRVVPVKEYTPKLTKHGTISRSSVPRKWTDLSELNGGPFTVVAFETFNARSHSQRIERLWQAGWQPINKSKSHREVEKTLRGLRRRPRGHAEEIRLLEERLGEYGESGFGYSGWMSTDEENLDTLPPDAPEQFKKLQRFVILCNRVSTLNSWLEVYNEQSGRIHGRFAEIGAWTHRMSHSEPNMGNIPKFDDKQPDKTPYSDKMRALWRSASEHVLIGVDAESIQLRIFGHYLNDKEFIHALTEGDKRLGTDPHSLNQKALGVVCKSRDDAKTFIYAWLLGAGVTKVSQILGCSVEEARHACDRFVEFYPGLAHLKKTVIPVDAARGYFRGFDGRYVRIWGDDEDERRHFTLAGYLQNGEAVIMKRGCQLWVPELRRQGVIFKIVNFVHDEWQVEVPKTEDAEGVAKTIADSIRQVGEDLGLNCPMAGSILNAHGRLAIGDNWMVTH